jgi:hypothetical protein
MKYGLGLGLALVCGVVAAAEPAARAKPGSMAAATKPPVPATAQLAKRLDLRIGNVRKYMMPREFQAALGTPDADTNTVVVEGQREIVPMKRVEDVPGGLASLWYAAKDPKNAWRLFAPVVTFTDGPTVDKVPPPVFRWGP